MELNFSDIADRLHITPQGARKKVLKYKDNEELKAFLIYNNNELKGIEEDGLEVLRNLGNHRRSYSKDRKLMDLEHKVELLEQENKHLLYERDREKEISDRATQENEKLKAEINEFANGGILKRLTYKKRV